MSRIAAALLELDIEGHTLAAEHLCVGSKYHSPTPLLVQQVEAGGLSLWLCGTCRDNLQAFLVLMDATQGDLSWEVRREFGNRIRDIGLRAWNSTEESQRG